MQDEVQGGRRAVRFARYAHAFKNVVEALAIVAAGCWAFYVFIYTDRIKPLAEPPTVNITHETRVGHRLPNGLLPMIDRVTLQNVGKIRVSILGETYATYGLTGSLHQTAKPTGPVRESTWNLDAWLTRPTPVKMVVHAFGRANHDEFFYLEPGETNSTDYVSLIAPKRHFDVVSVNVGVVFTKREDPALTAPFRRDPFGFPALDTDGIGACVARGVEDETAACPLSSTSLAYLQQM